MAIRHSVEDVGDVERLEDLGAGGVVVAAEEEEALEHLGGEGGVDPRRGHRVRRGGPVAADPAYLPFLALVVVPADPARVLPLALPHLPPAAGRRAAPLDLREGGCGCGIAAAAWVLCLPLGIGRAHV